MKIEVSLRGEREKDKEGFVKPEIYFEAKVKGQNLWGWVTDSYLNRKLTMSNDSEVTRRLNGDTTKYDYEFDLGNLEGICKNTCAIFCPPGKSIFGQAIITKFPINRIEEMVIVIKKKRNIMSNLLHELFHIQSGILGSKRKYDYTKDEEGIELATQVGVRYCREALPPIKQNIILGLIERIKVHRPALQQYPELLEAMHSDYTSRRVDFYNQRESYLWDSPQVVQGNDKLNLMMVGSVFYPSLIRELKRLKSGSQT